MIQNTLPHKSANPERITKKCQQFESFSTNVPIAGEDLLRTFYLLYFYLFYLQFCDSSDQWKNTVYKGFTSDFRDTENNRIYIVYGFSYKFVFILILPFLTNQKQQVGSLVTRNTSAFCLYQVALYFKSVPNSVDFY